MTDSRDRTRGPQRRQRDELQALLDALAAGDAEQVIASLLRTGLTPDETKLVQLYRRLNATQKAGVRGLIEGFLQAEPTSGPQRFPGPVGQMSSCH